MIAQITQFEANQPSSRELLREAHHRITNHLALLVAMIRTQNAAIKKGPQTLTREAASDVLDEISASVVAMAHLNRQLVRHPGSATVELGSLLAESCSEMLVSLGLKGRVRFRHTLRSACEVTAEEAPSLNLLLSEIVMNAIKYARPTGRLVEIDVSSRRTAEGHPVVVISDNGKGLSLDFDERGHTGAGFQIIRALAQKLQANLTIESNEHGLTFHVLLPARVDWPEMAPPLQAVG